MPYTYLIGWTSLNLWYYGVRYSVKAHPTDLWVTYFTSSKRVKQLREKYGEPDVIQIRKTFGDPHKAKDWEDKILRRMNTKFDSKWINQTMNDSFRGIVVPWNKGLNKNNSEKMKEIGRSISKSCKGRQSPHKGKLVSEESKIKNSWTQIIEHNPSLQFKTYSEFADDVIRRYQQTRKGPYSLGTFYKVDGGTIKRIIHRYEATMNC